MARPHIFRTFAAAAVCWLAVTVAQAAETFQAATTPGGLKFWHLQRADAQRSVVLASFVDVFALKHPDKIAAPIVGASLMQSGPKGISSGEFNEQLKDLQARGGVSVSPMSALFSVEAKPDDLREALDLCIRLITDPALRQTDIERIRKATVANRARLETNRGGLAAYLMRKLTSFDGPFGRWAEPEEIVKIGAADVELWRGEVFARDNLTLITVGTQDADAFGAMIDSAFSELPAKAAPTDAIAPAPVYSGKTVVLERDGTQTAIIMEGALAINNREGPAATIGNNVLGGGLDRRLSKAVRGEQGATYGISSGIGQLAPGQRTFSIRSSLANDLAAAGLNRAREEYQRWRNDGVSEDEAAAARSLLATNFDKGAETPGGKAFALIAMLRTGRNAEDEALYAERVRQTDVGEVNRVLREKMPAKLTTLIVAPKAEGFAADCIIKEVSEIDTCR